VATAGQTSGLKGTSPSVPTTPEPCFGVLL
jgi:hypothetical protein